MFLPHTAKKKVHGLVISYIPIVPVQYSSRIMVFLAQMPTIWTAALQGSRK